mgnify:CR=1 FL=1
MIRVNQKEYFIRSNVEFKKSKTKNNYIIYVADMGKFSGLENCEKNELVIEWKILLRNFLSVIFSIL